MTPAASASLSFSLQPFAAPTVGGYLPLSALSVALTWPAAERLRLVYHWHCHPDTADALCLPAPVAAPGPADGLWQHSCVELFVALPEQPGYLEFNFSPSGQWAAYAFADYRQRLEGTACPELPRPGIDCQRMADSVVLTADLPLAAFPPAFRQAAQWQIGLTAVVEAASGALSYWALHHPGERPDFHHRGGMVATLALPETQS